MPDIMKYITDEQALDRDPQGHMLGLEEWSEEIARRRAAGEGLELTPRHWDVIRFLRDYHGRHGPEETARAVLHALEQRFAHDGGKKYLYVLFPGGPVTQGSRIAGLPLPPGAVDASFGTAW